MLKRLLINFFIFTLFLTAFAVFEAQTSVIYAFGCKKTEWCPEPECVPARWVEKEVCCSGGGSCPPGYSGSCDDLNECGSCGSQLHYCDGQLTCDACDAPKMTVGGTILSSGAGPIAGAPIAGVKVNIFDNTSQSWQVVTGADGRFFLVDKIVSTRDYAVRPDSSALPVGLQPPPKTTNNYDSWMHPACNGGVWMNQSLGSASYECQVGDYAGASPHQNGGCKLNCNFVYEAVSPTPTPCPPLSPPVASAECVYTIGATKITYSWSAVAGADLYSLRLDDLDDGHPWDGSCGGGNDRCDDTTATTFTYNIIPGHRYNFWLSARNNCGSWSDSPSRTHSCPLSTIQPPTDTPPPTIPPIFTLPPTEPPPTIPGAVCGLTSVSASDNYDRQIVVDYQVANGRESDGLEIFYNDGTGDKPLTPVDPVNGRFVHRNLPQCVTYLYRVCCREDLGNNLYRYYGCRNDPGSTICPFTPTPTKPIVFPSITPTATLTPTVTPTQMPTPIPNKLCPFQCENVTFTATTDQAGRVILNWNINFSDPRMHLHVGHHRGSDVKVPAYLRGPLNYNWWPIFSSPSGSVTEDLPAYPPDKCLVNQPYVLGCYYTYSGVDKDTSKHPLNMENEINCGGAVAIGGTYCAPTMTPTPIPPAGFYYCPI